MTEVMHFRRSLALLVVAVRVWLVANNVEIYRVNKLIYACPKVVVVSRRTRMQLFWLPGNLNSLYVESYSLYVVLQYVPLSSGVSQTCSVFML